MQLFPRMRRAVVPWALRIGSLLLALGATGAQSLVQTGCNLEGSGPGPCLPDGRSVGSLSECEQCRNGCHDAGSLGLLCGDGP